MTNKKQVAKKGAGKEKQVAKKDVGKKRIAKKGAGDKQVAENKQVAEKVKEKSRSPNTDKPKIKTEIETEIDLMKTASVSAKPKTSSGRPYGSIVAQYASSYGVPVALAHAVIQVESNYRPDARGSAGEIGLMQIKPATARMMGYSGGAQGLFDPATNIKYGMKYLGKARELGGGTTCGTILKYNAGHAAKRMNPVSSAYCKKVQVHLGA
ncbi:MAG: lytic transglycosylase domain-containing protein [Pseudaminobacter sp.]|nr:lytic transglycosylase domain-containing protein [Pseudaminobacter sp.]